MVVLQFLGAEGWRWGGGAVGALGGDFAGEHRVAELREEVRERVGSVRHLSDWKQDPRERQKQIARRSPRTGGLAPLLRQGRSFAA